MYVIWPSSSLSYNSDKVGGKVHVLLTTHHPPLSFSLLSFPRHPHNLQTFHRHHHLLPSNPAADADADAAPAIHQSIVEDLPPPPPPAAPAPPPAPLLPV